MAAQSGARKARNTSSAGKKSNTKSTAGSGRNSNSRSDKSANTKRATGGSGKSTNQRQGRNSSSKNAGKQMTSEEIRMNDAIKEDVKIIVSLAIMIILTLSNFSMCGAFGKVVSDVMFGLTGVFAYVLPFMMFLGVMFLIANKGKTAAVRKFSAVVILMLMLCTFVQLWTSGSNGIFERSDFYRRCAESKSGGGLLGGEIGYLLSKAMGLVGAYILVIALIVICLVVIFNRPIMRKVGTKSKDAYSHAKEKHERRKVEKLYNFEAARNRRDDALEPGEEEENVPGTQGQYTEERGTDKRARQE